MENKQNLKDIGYIIFLLNKMKTKYSETNDFEVHPAGSRYLLGQTLRQIILPNSSIFISYKADVLWKKLRAESKDSMSDYVNQKRVINENDHPIPVLIYKGASSSSVPRILKKRDYFSFRQVFHDEHIIPIKMIIDELFKLENPDYDSVMRVMKKICICRMLKSEDRKIKEHYKRDFSRKDVIEKLYLGYGIYLKDYEYPHQEYLIEDNFEDSIHLAIPEEIVIRYLPHPEEYGDSLIELPNGMITDIYKDESNNIYTITNDNKLIRYVMILQEAFAEEI